MKLEMFSLEIKNYSLELCEKCYLLKELSLEKPLREKLKV